MNMDEAIKATFPLMAAPTQGSVPPASASGTRYLVASDGVWRELTLPWVRFRHQLAAAAMRLPYGELEPMIEIRCGAIPPELIRAFVADAREACPNEIAGVFLWHEPIVYWLRDHGLVAAGAAGFVLNTAVLFVIAVALSVVTYRLVELPALRLKRRTAPGGKSDPVTAVTATEQARA